VATIDYPPTVKVPASITFDFENLYVDGVRISLALLPQMLYELTHPDPRKWYRLERVGNDIVVHLKISEEKPDGNPIASTNDAGVSSSSPGREG
jgi:hypothetical protein